MNIFTISTFTLAMLMAACTPLQPYRPTENSASTGSGITVFGEVDTSVTHTR